MKIRFDGPVGLVPLLVTDSSARCSFWTLLKVEVPALSKLGWPFDGWARYELDQE